ITVSDGSAGASTSFLLTVTPVNDPPTLDFINNIFVNQGASLQTIGLTGISAGPNENQILAVSAISGNPALIPNPVVTYTSPAATGSLGFAPVPGASGVATITVTVNDGQRVNNLFSRTFTLTVNAAPPIPALADR